MFIFYLTVIFTYILYFLARVSYEKNFKILAIFWSILVASILILVSGLRNGIGDTFMYMHSYRAIAADPSSANLDRDAGFNLLSILLTYISSDPQVLIFTTALITNLLNIIMFNRYRSYLELQVYIYITSGYYFVTMNGIRQCLAAALLFVCTIFIEKGKFKTYCILVILISSFHQSALMMIPLYFVVREEAWSKRMIKLMLVATTCIVLYNIISPLIFKALENTNYGEYATYDAGGSSLMRTIVNLVPVVLAYIKREEIKEKWTGGNIFVNMSIVNLIFVSLGMFNWVFNRFTLYLQLYNFVLIPFVIKNCFKGKEKRLIYFLLLVCYFIFLYYEQVISMNMSYPSKYKIENILF